MTPFGRLVPEELLCKVLRFLVPVKTLLELYFAFVPSLCHNFTKSSFHQVTFFWKGPCHGTTNYHHI